MRHEPATPLEALHAALHHAEHLIPAQSPLDRFVHHNPLHAFEDLPFPTAVEVAARALGNEPWLPEAAYLEAFRLGRVVEKDLDGALGPDDGAPCAWRGGRRELRRRVMLHPIAPLTTAATAWQLAEGGAAERLRADLPADARAGVCGGHVDEAWAVGRLWEACVALAPAPRPPAGRDPVRVADWVAARRGLDLDALVHAALVRWAAAYLDHGLAYWPMADRELGFLEAVRRHAGDLAAVRPWTRGLAGRLAAGSSEAVAIAALAELGHPQETWEEVVAETLLALRGYAGMFARLASAPDHAPHADLALPADLASFLAVRLAMDASAAAWALPGSGPLLDRARALPEPARGPDADPRWTLFQLAQVLGLGADRLRELGPAGAASLLDELSAFDAVARRRTWHEAYELRHRARVFDAVGAPRPDAPAPPARVQAVFCIDDREESTRRHLEELAPWVETLGFAGNFGIAVVWRGGPRGLPTTLAAAGVVARHAVHESTPPAPGAWLTHLEVGAGTLVRGAAASLLGVAAAVPLALGLLAPERLLPERRTGPLDFRHDPSRSTPDLQFGFTVEEMATICRNTLRIMGLTEGFAPLVLICGHESTTTNNPHHAAYQCGACGGAPGGHNARLFARFIGEPDVRARLAELGVPIPDGTWFVGGTHDTSTDAFHLFDLDRVPATHRAALDELRAALDAVSALDAQERCRKFEHAPLGISPPDALRHVRRRAADPAQPRPEYGHGTNAICLVGRRSWSKGLFLDRRAFLVSYDPTRDPDGSSLARLLGVVLPVGSGINLEYWFGSVDPLRYGSGTKLAHNLTGLLGVMDGHASDLRTGLPWQTLELHEPVRLACVVEATPDALLRVAEGNPAVARLVVNRWVHLAAFDPATRALQVFEDGRFRPWEPDDPALPHVARSADWFAGTRALLGPARIGGSHA